MPTHMRARFSEKELADWEMAEPFSFTKGLRTMKIKYRAKITDRPSRLYNIKEDPEQLHEIKDEAVVKKMKALISEYMHETDAPKELYHRFGIKEIK